MKTFDELKNNIFDISYMDGLPFEDAIELVNRLQTSYENLEMIIESGLLKGTQYEDIAIKTIKEKKEG